MEEQKEVKKGAGGARANAGRKTKAEEDNVTLVFLSALKEVYRAETDFDAKVGFTKDLLDSQRGQIFVAEHIFGKPKEIIENINIDAGKLTDEEIKLINKSLERTY